MCWVHSSVYRTECNTHDHSPLQADSFLTKKGAKCGRWKLTQIKPGVCHFPAHSPCHNSRNSLMTNWKLHLLQVTRTSSKQWPALGKKKELTFRYSCSDVIFHNSNYFTKYFVMTSQLRQHCFSQPVARFHEWTTLLICPIGTSSVSFFNEFLPRTIKQWNNLPDFLATDSNTYTFIENLISHLKHTKASIYPTSLSVLAFLYNCTLSVV